MSARRMRTQAEWKVDTHISRARLPTRSTTRCRISAAALLVKVIARIDPGCTSRCADQVGDPPGQHPGLARAGAGHHQHGAAGVQHGLALRRVEAGEQFLLADPPDAAGARRRPAGAAGAAVSGGWKAVGEQVGKQGV